jgi:4-amino-4-deoxychorismate lyase
MSNLLIETIRYENGRFHNLSYHQARMQKSRHALFEKKEPVNLEKLLTAPTEHTSTVRCRITYAEEIERIEYFPYRPKQIRQLYIVPAAIDYPYKFANRDAFKSLFEHYPDADEIIVEKEGLLTDATIANIALFRDGKWYTPASPLLEGTMRAKLLDEGKLHLQDIPTSSLHTYTHVALINAMIGLSVIEDAKLYVAPKRESIE